MDNHGNTSARQYTSTPSDAVVPEKCFPADLFIVESKGTLRNHVGALVLMVVLTLIGVAGTYLGLRWTARTFSGEGTLWDLALALMATLVAILFALGGPLATLGSIYDILDVQKLDRRAVRGQARVVGRERISQEDAPDQLIVFYQFDPTFVVRVRDDTPDQRLYNLPNDSPIDIEYLPENPQACRLHTASR